MKWLENTIATSALGVIGGCIVVGMLKSWPIGPIFDLLWWIRR